MGGHEVDDISEETSKYSAEEKSGLAKSQATRRHDRKDEGRARHVQTLEQVLVKKIRFN